MGLRLAHLSDIHFGGENVAAVEGVARWLGENPVDLVIVTGDITVGGALAEFDAAERWLKALPHPLLVTPGNHDTPYLGIAERLLAPWGRFERRLGPADGVRWSKPGAAIVTMNTARGVQVRWNWSKGAVSKGQAEAALEALSPRAPGDLAIVACHHPLVEMIGGPMTGNVRGGETAAKMFCQGGVDLVLTGHIHAPFAFTLPHCGGGTHAVGASTLSVRERGVPVGFNVIEPDAETIAVTAQAWTGSRYETWRTWALPRRSKG